MTYLRRLTQLEVLSRCFGDCAYGITVQPDASHLSVLLPLERSVLWLNDIQDVKSAQLSIQTHSSNRN